MQPGFAHCVVGLWSGLCTDHQQCNGLSLLLLLAWGVVGVERVEIFVYLAVHLGRFQVVLLVPLHTLAGHVLQRC